MLAQRLARDLAAPFHGHAASVATPSQRSRACISRLSLSSPSKAGTQRVSHVAKAVEVPSYVPASLPEASVDELKAQLLDSLFGTERGLTATSETRAELNDIITQLEAKNPYPSLEKAGIALDGQWKLVYTSNSELVALLALNRLPFISVGDITQTIDSTTLTAVNTVALTGPFSRTSVSTSASFEIRSPKRLQVKFEKGIIATPKLLQDVELPSSISVLGQPVDVSALKAALRPVEGFAQGAVRRVATFVSQQPDLQFPLPAGSAQTWLINTYLDVDLRISRGDAGSVFVLVKDVALQVAQLKAEIEFSAEFEE